MACYIWGPTPTAEVLMVIEFFIAEKRKELVSRAPDGATGTAE